MSGNRFYLLVILTLLGILGYLAFNIMKPFFTAIGWSLVFTIVFYPVYAFMTRRVRFRPLASGITILLMVIIIVGPLAYLSVMIFKEVQVFAAGINEGSMSDVKGFISNLRASPTFGRIAGAVGLDSFLSEEAVTSGLQRLGRGVVEQLSIGIPNAISILVDFVFMLFTTFFFLMDGTAILAKARDYMPFSEIQKERLARQIKDMVVSTVYGGVAIAIIQGLLGGMAFYVVGVEAPALWGVAMSIMSFVPLLGTFSIWGPTAIYLVFQGSYLYGIGLFLYGVFVISLVDNILKPVIIGSRTKMPTILILFSVLGGIKLFGMIGLVMGPLIIAIFISVFEIFKTMEGVEAPPA